MDTKQRYFLKGDELLKAIREEMGFFRESQNYVDYLTKSMVRGKSDPVGKLISARLRKMRDFSEGNY